MQSTIFFASYQLITQKEITSVLLTIFTHFIIVEYQYNIDIISDVTDYVLCWRGQSPPHYTKCNSQPINGQCTNYSIANLLFDGPSPPIPSRGEGRVRNKCQIFIKQKDDYTEASYMTSWPTN